MLLLDLFIYLNPFYQKRKVYVFHTFFINIRYDKMLIKIIRVQENFCKSEIYLDLPPSQ